MVKWSSLDPRRLGLVVHDMQSVFLEEWSRFGSPQSRSVIPKTKRLITECRARRVPVIYIQGVLRPDFLDCGLIRDVFPMDALQHLVEGSEGAKIHPELAPREGEPVIRKCSQSGFFNTNLDGILRNLGLEGFAITGVDTNVGCESLTRDAFYRGFKVLFLTDATATHGIPDVGFGKVSPEDAHRVSCSTIGYCFAELSTTEDFLRRIA